MRHHNFELQADPQVFDGVAAVLDEHLTKAPNLGASINVIANVLYAAAAGQQALDAPLLDEETFIALARQMYRNASKAVAS